MGSDDFEHLHYRIRFEGVAQPLDVVLAVPADMHAVRFQGMVERGPILEVMIRQHYPEYGQRPWRVEACRTVTEQERRALARDAPEAVHYTYPSWVDLEFEPGAYGPPESNDEAHG